MATAEELRLAREQTSIFRPFFERLREERAALAAEGRRPVLGGLLSKEPVMGTDTIRYEGIGPMIRGVLEPVARGIDAPRAAYEGLIPAEDMAAEAFGTAGVTSLGGAAATKPAGALGANSFRGEGRGPTFEEAPMIVHHNVSPQGLAVSESIGGMPMPSIGISNANFPLDNFGDISLILKPEKIAPRRDLPVYPADAYTGRQPRAEVQLENERMVQSAVAADPNFSHMRDKDNWMRSYDNFEDNDHMMRVAQFGIDNRVSNPKDFERFSDFVRDVRNKAGGYIDSEDLDAYAGLRQYGDTKLMMRPEDPYTALGTRRKSKEYTADEAFKRMRKNRASEAGSENHQGAGMLRAVLAEKFKNLDDIKANRGLLIPRGNELEDTKATFSNLSFNVTEDLSNMLGGSMYSAGNYLTDLAMGRDTSWAKATPEIEAFARGKLEELRQVVSGMPTEYFEAKPRSMAQIGDFDAAVVPANAASSIDILRRAGLKDIRTYDPEVSGKRREDVIRGMDDFFFANASTPAGVLGAVMSDEDQQRAMKQYLAQRGPKGLLN